jgi:hypothetical protein
VDADVPSTSSLELDSLFILLMQMLRIGWSQIWLKQSKG